MERRREPRFPIGQRATLRVLKEKGEPGEPIQAHICDISKGGARLQLEQPVQVGDAVRVDIDDSILLGEVCHCSMKDGRHVCGLQVDQVLSGVADLARLMEAILGPAAQTRDPAVARRRHG